MCYPLNSATSVTIVASVSIVSEAMFAGGRFVESREAEIEIPQWSHVAFSAMLVTEPSRTR